MGSSLSNPGKYEELNKEAKGVLTPDLFDGFRLEFTKPVSPKFSLRHMMWMGSQQVPSFYEFGANYMSQNMVLLGSMDHMYRLNARAGGNITKNLSGMAQASITPPTEDGQDMSGLALNMDYVGTDFSAGAKLAGGGGNVLMFHYLQSVTKNMSLGTEFQYHEGNSVVSGAARYETPEFIATAQLYSIGLASAQYLHKVGDKAAFATEFGYNHMTKESQVTAGYQFALRDSTIRGQVNSHMKVAAVLERRLQPGFNMLMSGEIDHKKKEYKFGYGFTIGQ